MQVILIGDCQTSTNWYLWQTMKKRISLFHIFRTRQAATLSTTALSGLHLPMSLMIQQSTRGQDTNYLGCDNTKPVRVTPEQIAAISDSAHLEEALLHAYEQVGKHVPVEHLSENEIIMRFVLNILERDQADAAIGLQIYLLEAPRYFRLVILAGR